MSKRHSIGLTKGPGETPHEFTFVSPDQTQVLKVGEFVVYQANVDGQKRDILAHIVKRRPLRLYPETFLANPNIDPDDLAAMVGYHQQEHERFELTASIVGYYDEKLGNFVGSPGIRGVAPYMPVK